MPNRAIAGGFDGLRWKLGIRRLQLLENNNIRLRLLKPLEQDFETTVYAIDVVGGDFRSPLSPSLGLATFCA
jgi:hypothetical protein